MSEDQFWLTPIGLALDLFAVHQQFTGQATPKGAVTIDNLIPYGL
jgi:hypothetical protein